MTPQTKALQLIDKYCIILEGQESIYVEEPWSKSTWEKAKECSLKAVDEIRQLPAKLSNYELAVYWKEVKQEIEKL